MKEKSLTEEEELLVRSDSSLTRIDRQLLATIDRERADRKNQEALANAALLEWSKQVQRLNEELVAMRAAWDDASLPEDSAIKLAHPTRTGKHEIFAEAVRFVGARRSKGALVELVNWLLARVDELSVELAKMPDADRAMLQVHFQRAGRAELRCGAMRKALEELRDSASEALAADAFAQRHG